MSLPYVTADLPGTGGVLRASPDDFVVEEVPLYTAQGDGQHLYVNITKVGLTTKEVQIGLERLFGLKKGDVSFAGMKDKRARTTQTFSLSVGHKPPVFAEAAAAQIAANLGLAEAFFARHAARFDWRPPRAGSVALVGLDAPSATAYCHALARDAGVLLLPGPFLGADDHSVRFGFGRAGFGAALEQYEGYLVGGRLRSVNR